MGAATDLTGFTSATVGLYDAFKTYNPSDPVSVQGLQNAIASFKASTLSLLSDFPALKNAGDTLGLGTALNSLNTDNEALTQAIGDNSQVGQVSAFLGIVSDASGVIGGVSAVAALGTAATGVGSSASVPLGVLGASAAGIGLAAAGAKALLDSDPNAQADLSNFLQTAQSVFGSGYAATALSGQASGASSSSVGNTLNSFLAGCAQAAENGTPVAFSCSPDYSTFSATISGSGGSSPYTMSASLRPFSI